MVEPKKLLAGVVLLSIIIANTINKEYVVYFVPVAIASIIYLWSLIYKDNIKNNHSNRAVKAFGLITFINLILVYAFSWYNG